MSNKYYSPLTSTWVHLCFSGVGVTHELAFCALLRFCFSVCLFFSDCVLCQLLIAPSFSVTVILFIFPFNHCNQCLSPQKL